MGNQKSSSLPPQLVEELEAMTSFTYAEINDLYRQFKKDCPDTKMSVEQFQQLYGDTFPNGNPEKFAELIFKTFDEDERGYIDFRQFLTTLSVQLKGSFDEKLMWLFNLYDTDHSGNISRENLLEMMTAIHDLNIGALPSEDQLSPEDVTNHIMKQTKSGHSDLITSEDFIEAALISNTLATILQGTIQAADSPYLLRKEIRGSLGIALHRRGANRRVEQILNYDDQDSRRESATSFGGNRRESEERRPSLTPEMLDFNAMLKR